MSEELFGIGKGKYYHIKTYVCQGNLADSEKISGILEKMGFTKTNEDDLADIIVFNTCAIRENAENRVFGELGRIKNLKKKNPNMLMILCGCMAHEENVVSTIESKYPQVDIVFGTHNIHMIGDFIYESLTKNSRLIDVPSQEGDIIENVPVKRDHNKKAWVNIMYGCSEFCTYCIVPYTRNGKREEVVKHKRKRKIKITRRHN